MQTSEKTIALKPLTPITEQSSKQHFLSRYGKALSIFALVWFYAVVLIGTPYMSLATISYFAMIAALLLVKYRKIHMALAVFSMTFDISLVALIEFNRQAIHTVTQFNLTPWQMAHVVFSSLAVVLYFPVFTLGFGRFKQKLKSPSSLFWHRRLAYAAFTCRTLGYVLMFSLLK